MRKAIVPFTIAPNSSINLCLPTTGFFNILLSKTGQPSRSLLDFQPKFALRSLLLSKENAFTQAIRRPHLN
jgi:hypothetical protein